MEDSDQSSWDRDSHPSGTESISYDGNSLGGKGKAKGQIQSSSHGHQRLWQLRRLFAAVCCYSTWSTSSCSTCWPSSEGFGVATTIYDSTSGTQQESPAFPVLPTVGRRRNQDYDEYQLNTEESEAGDGSVFSSFGQESMDQDSQYHEDEDEHYEDENL